MAWLRMPSVVVDYRLAIVISLAFWLLHHEAGWGGHETDDDVLTVSAEQVKSFLEAREKLVIIDLRPLGDFQKTRLPGARSLPLTELDRRFHEIPKAGRVVLYCDCPQNQI